jgi:hypothetical protein
VTAALTLENGVLEWRVRANLSGKGDSPLLGLLPDKAAPRELLHYAPDDVLLAVGGGFGDGEKRWKTFVALLDALDKLDGRGEGNRASDHIGEMEEKVKLQIGKDILAPLTGAALVVDGGARAEQSYHPLLVLRASDAEAARQLEEKGLPKLIGLPGGRVPVPTEDDIDGQHIRTVEGALPGQKALSYGRDGAVLVVGLEGKRVARALTVGAKKEGLLAGEKVAAAVKELDADAVMVGVVSSAEAAGAAFLLAGREAPAMQKMPVPGGAAAPPPPAAKKGPKEADEARKARRELSKATGSMTPCVLSLSRKPDALVLEMRQVGLRRAVPALLDVWIDATLHAAGQGPVGIGAGVKGPAPAAKR